jgi:hypothetical protein
MSMPTRSAAIVAAFLAAAGLAFVPAVATAADGRAYELVSPADTGGNDLEPVRVAQPARPVQVSSSDGSAILFSNIIGGLIDGAESGANNLYRSVRTPTGWQTRYTGPPAAAGGQYRVTGASDDLRHLIFQQDYGTRLDPADPDPIGDASVPDLRLFSSIDGSSFTRLDRGSAMAPFDEPGRDQVNSSVLLATDPSATDAVFATNRRMEPEPDGGLGLNKGRVYLRADGQTRLVSVDEAGRPFWALSPTWPASSDLRRIFLQGQRTGSVKGNRVYLWNDGTTIEASASRRATPDPASDRVTLQDVSGDGRSAIMRTKLALTDDDTPDGGGANSGQDLYVFRLPASDDVGAASLTRITGSTPGTSARLVAASRDHRRIYFSSDEALTRGAEAGRLNLYLYVAGSTRLVATLADADREVPDPSGDPDAPAVPSSFTEGPDETQRQTRISDDGSVIVFRSQAALAGAPGGSLNLFRFDEADGGLACVSCALDGGASGETQFSNGQSRGRNLTADGAMVFFDTTTAIDPADVNGTWDVYEYDAGTGTSKLVSNGTSPRGARYIDNSASGRDVFFETRDPLVPQDRNGSDEAQRIYTAHVGGGFPVDVPQPPCVGEGCRGLVADRPSPTAVGSVANTGAGDPPVAKAPRVVIPARAPNLGRVSLSKARSFARTGRLLLTVRGLGGRVRLRGTVDEIRGARRIRLATGSRQVKSASSAVLTIRATRAGRARLRSGQRLRLRITVMRSGTARSAARTLIVPATRRAR